MQSFSAEMQSEKLSGKGSSSNVISSSSTAHVLTQSKKALKHTGISLMCPSPKTAFRTHVARGCPHCAPHFCVSPPIHMASSVTHFTFSNPVEAFMQSFSA